MNKSHPVETEEQHPVRFRHRMPVQIRFSDVDRYGHVNNNAYFAYYDLGKQEYLYQVLKINYRESEIVPVIANINADFIMPIFYGDEIVVETRVAHIGHKSFTLQQRAVNVTKNVVVCQCSTVMVCFNLKTQEATDMPENYRQAIEAFELEYLD